MTTAERLAKVLEPIERRVASMQTVKNDRRTLLRLLKAALPCIKQLRQEILGHDVLECGECESVRSLKEFDALVDELAGSDG